MGSVLLHVGMPKTGSTSIQSWLRSEAAWLAGDHGITVLREVDGAIGASVRFEPFDGGFTPALGRFVLQYAAARGDVDDQRRLDLAAQLVEALDVAASAHGTVLATSEALSTLLVLGDRPFVDALERLAGHHGVRVACYVRPQDRALEARWRQWGYRGGVDPSEWVAAQVGELRYSDTVREVEQVAPRVFFEVRPFRQDLLDSGSVVTDFARQFLGIDQPRGTAEHRDNPGLTLDVANLLRTAPPGVLEAAGEIETGLRQLQLGQRVRRWAIPESHQARASRQLLRRFAYAEFEPGNRELIARFGWPIDDFVAPPSASDGPTDLAELDTLWQPQASPTALAHLHAAFLELCRS